LAFTQTDLDAIDSAIKSGHLEVQYSDKKVKYRDLDEMLRIREMIRKEVSPQSSDSRTVAEFSKGL